MECTGWGSGLAVQMTIWFDVRFVASRFAIAMIRDVPIWVFSIFGEKKIRGKNDFFPGKLFNGATANVALCLLDDIGTHYRVAMERYLKEI